jgi:hypothetical protein
MARKRSWADLTTQQKTFVVAGAVVQLTLLSAALLDLRKRRPEEVNGPKAAWAAASFVNYVGPIAYFVLGRKRR